MPSEKQIQEMLNDLKFEQTMSLIRLLALNFTKNTKRVVVPKGTNHWKVIYDAETIKLIPLIEFFGMYVGYDAQLDILVYWIP